MKKRIIVGISIVILLCSVVFCVAVQRKRSFVEGVVIEKNEQFLILETDIQEEIICYLPEKYDYSVISPGDNIKVYYSGEILETSPARIKNVKEIEK